MWKHGLKMLFVIGPHDVLRIIFVKYFYFFLNNLLSTLYTYYYL
jgi:hypothetical protein